MKKIKARRNVIIQTIENFAARTTVHGISYIFDPELKVVDRYTQPSVHFSNVCSQAPLAGGGAGLLLHGSILDLQHLGGLEGGSGKYWNNHNQSQGSKFCQ